MFRAVPNHIFAALLLVTLLGPADPAVAQILGLDVDLGGLGSVDVDVGGDSGLGLDVNVGGDDGLDVDLGVGGDDGLDVDLGVGGDDGLGVDLGGVDEGVSGLDLVPDGLALGQQAASAAVRNGRALPLEDILLRAKLLIDGDVIDAQLIAVQDVLLYELKVLGKAGDVSELYFYALSGQLVETN